MQSYPDKQLGLILFFFFSFFPSLCSLSLPHSSFILSCLSPILSALRIQTDIQVFKCCLAFTYQMEGDYSRTVLIMSDRYADTYTERILKMCLNFLIADYKSVCCPSACKKLQLSGAKQIIRKIFLFLS